MARDRQPPPDTSGDVPAWFMTYSDVITLLMTFFILLLTFATSEPETFTRMQVAMFGGGGATGIAGPKPESLEEDSFLIRRRPVSGRLTDRGSEMPPMYVDPLRESVSAGLQSLEDSEEVEDADQRAVDLSIPLLFDNPEALSTTGQKLVRLLSTQMVRMKLLLRIELSGPELVDYGMTFATALQKQPGIKPSQVSLVNTAAGESRGTLRTVIVKQR